MFVFFNIKVSSKEIDPKIWGENVNFYMSVNA